MFALFPASSVPFAVSYGMPVAMGDGLGISSEILLAPIQVMFSLAPLHGAMCRRLRSMSHILLLSIIIPVLWIGIGLRSGSRQI